jgi:hypothetical protein
MFLFLRANSTGKEASECMHLLKQRAEYEMYADVILVRISIFHFIMYFIYFFLQMTESMGYLHEFETQRPEQQDIIGIEIELPPTIDMVKQKRTATTARSIKNRHRSHKHHHQNEIGE